MLCFALPAAVVLILERQSVPVRACLACRTGGARTARSGREGSPPHPPLRAPSPVRRERAGGEGRLMESAVPDGTAHRPVTTLGAGLWPGAPSLGLPAPGRRPASNSLGTPLSCPAPKAAVLSALRGFCLVAGAVVGRGGRPTGRGCTAAFAAQAGALVFVIAIVAHCVRSCCSVAWCSAGSPRIWRPRQRRCWARAVGRLAAREHRAVPRNVRARHLSGSCS